MKTTPTFAYQAAIFDMDGLLIDSENIIMQACIQAATELDIPYTKQCYIELIGRTAPDSASIMKQQLGGAVQYHRVMERVDAMLDTRNHAFPLKPGVTELLAHLYSRDIPCAVASSSYRDVVEHRLMRADILRHFQVIASGDEVSRGKPHPDIYQLALQKLELNANTCIVFEDSEPGVKAARAAGLRVIMVPDIKQPDDDLQAEVITTLSQAKVFF